AEASHHRGRVLITRRQEAQRPTEHETLALPQIDLGQRADDRLRATPQQLGDMAAILGWLWWFWRLRGVMNLTFGPARRTTTRARIGRKVAAVVPDAQHLADTINRRSPLRPAKRAGGIDDAALAGSERAQLVEVEFHFSSSMIARGSATKSAIPRTA